MTGTTALDRVRNAVEAEGQAPTGTVFAQAPGSVEILGDPCTRAGGMLITSALPVYAAVALTPDTSGELTVNYRGDTFSTPLPDSVSDDLPWVVEAVALAVNALQHNTHQIPVNDIGMTVTVDTDVPENRGLGAFSSIECAVALAANAVWGDRDDTPTRAKLASTLHEVSSRHLGYETPIHPFTTALRSQPDSILVCNHADGAVTQMERPDSMSLLIASSPDTIGSRARSDRPEFFTDACRAFGVPTLAELPDSETRVLEWVRARHDVGSEDDLPTENRAESWMEETSASSDRAHALAGHIKHGNVPAALACIKTDVNLSGLAPSPDTTIGRIYSTALNAGAACRPVSGHGAALVAWAPVESAEEVATALHAAGADVIRASGTNSGRIVEFAGS